MTQTKTVMKKYKIIPLLMLIFIVPTISAQDIDTLYASKDALIRYYDHQGDPVNHGDYEYLNMHAWTNAGIFVLHRSLIDFDLSSVNPDNSFTATLKLFSDKNSTFYPDGHQYLQSWPENAILIQRVTEEWEEYEVNWNNRPDVTYQNVIFNKPSTNNFQDYEIDVTNMLIDMLEDPANSHGFLIRLEMEWIYNRLVFASSDNKTEEFHPRLEIAYDVSAVNAKTDIENPMNVYPNPATNEITISIGQVGGVSPYKLRIYNSMGQTILRIDNIRNEKSRIDLSGFDKGIYSVTLYQDNSPIGSQNFIVQ